MDKTNRLATELINVLDAVRRHLPRCSPIPKPAKKAAKDYHSRLIQRVEDLIRELEELPNEP